MFLWYEYFVPISLCLNFASALKKDHWITALLESLLMINYIRRQLKAINRPSCLAKIYTNTNLPVFFIYYSAS